MSLLSASRCRARSAIAITWCSCLEVRLRASERVVSRLLSGFLLVIVLPLCGDWSGPADEGRAAAGCSVAVAVLAASRDRHDEAGGLRAVPLHPEHPGLEGGDAAPGRARAGGER